MSRLRQASEERGFALVMAIGIMVVTSLILIAAIDYASSNARSAHTSRGDAQAYSLAEAALNNIESILNTGSNALTSTALDPTSGSGDCDATGVVCQSKVYDTGTAKWRGTYDPATFTWSVWAYGYVQNPTGFNGKLIERKLSARIGVRPDATQPKNATAWNYVFATNTSNATTCDMTLSNSAAIDAPLYVAGNLCLNNTSSVVEPTAGDPVTLTVLGKLALLGSNGVGVKGPPIVKITNANIGGGCVSSIGNTGHTCAPAGDYFYVTNYSSTATPIATPTADWPGYYASAAPGPGHPCTTTSGTPPVWDNDATQNFTTSPNGSVTPAFNLTPGSDYTCRYAVNGSTIGELSWVASTHTLTVKGVMYIDGSAYISNNATNVYNGSATIYLSGTFSMSLGSTRLCAVNSGSTCNFSTWDPSAEMLIFVTHGNDGSGNSATFSNGVQFEGGLFAENAVDPGNSATIEGPMIADTIRVNNSVSFKPLPYITTLPLGAPGNPNTHASPAPPTNFSG